QAVGDIPVIGGDVVVHIDATGAVYAINGTARGDITLPDARIAESQAGSIVANDPRFAALTQTSLRRVVLRTPRGMQLAFEVEVTGMRGQDPVRDHVFVD